MPCYLVLQYSSPCNPYQAARPQWRVAYYAESEAEASRLVEQARSQSYLAARRQYLVLPRSEASRYL